MTWGNTLSIMCNRKTKIPIVGDFISTYLGYNPYNYPVYYKDDKAYDNEIKSVDNLGEASNR